MESFFDGTLVNVLSSFNIAIAFVMFCYYSLNGSRWNRLARFGWLVMAGGLLIQSIVVVDHIDYDDNWFLYFWAIKNVGCGAFVLGLLQSWSKRD